MKDLTKGNIYKTFFLFGLPLVLSGLLSQTYHVIDTAIAGQFIGETALAAMGATGPLISFLSSLIWGYGVGFSIYIARLYSSGKHENITSTVYTTVFLLFVFCAFIAFFSILFHDQLFDILQIKQELRADAYEYFFFYILGLFFILFPAFGLYIMNSFGIGSFPFFMSLVSAVLNITGNILSVTVLGWGIKGLAISTVFSAGVVSVCYVFKFFSCLKEMGVSKKGKLGFAYLRNSLPFSLPNMFQQGVMYFASLGISPLVNAIGVSAAASYSVVSQVMNINTSVYQNSARTVSNYTAQCVGSNQHEKINKGVLVGLLQGIAFVLPFVLVCSIFHKPVCDIFIKADADALTREYSYLFASTYLPFIFINLVCNLFHGLFRGVKASGHLFVTTFVGAFSRLIYSWLLIPSMGMSGFFLGWVLSWVTEAVLCVVLFFLGGWKTKEHTV